MSTPTPCIPHSCTSSQPDKRLAASLPTNPCEARLHVPHIRRNRPAILPSRVPGTTLRTGPKNGARCTGHRNALHWPSQSAASAIAAYCVPLSETAQKTEEREAHIREAQSGIPDSPLGRAERSILPIRTAPCTKRQTAASQVHLPQRGGSQEAFPCHFPLLSTETHHSSFPFGGKCVILRTR